MEPGADVINYFLSRLRGGEPDEPEFGPAVEFLSRLRGGEHGPSAVQC